MNAHYSTQTLRNRKGIAAYIATRPAPVIEVVPEQPEPANFCAEPGDTDASLPRMLFDALLALIAWAVFGWAVVTAWRMW